MCDRCQAERTGLRLGTKGVFSKLIGLHSCKHSSGCTCEKCVYDD